MKKNLLQSTLVAIAILLCSCPAMAYDFLSGGIPYNITNENSKTVETTYFGELTDNDYIYQNWLNLSGQISIPEKVTYNGVEYQVTAVGPYAMTGASKITSVTLPNSITSIGEGAFATCNGITSISLGNNVKTIDTDAFLRCTSLTQITLPATLTSIGEDAFTGTGLTLIVALGETPATAHQNAFRGITETATVQIPSANALSKYKAATGWSNFKNFSYDVVVTLNTDVKTMYISETAQLVATVTPATENASIAWSSSNTSVATVDNKGVVTSISAGSATITATATIQGQEPKTTTCKINVLNKYNFNNTYYEIVSSTDKTMAISFAGATYDEVANEYTGYVDINNNLANGYKARMIGDNAFRDCDLISVKFRDNAINRYGEYAFAGCSNLATMELTILNSTIKASIEKNAFDGAGLVHITIPVGVTTIADYAFANCSKLMTVVAKSNTPIEAQPNTFSNLPTGATLYVPQGSLNAYKAATGWNAFGNNIVEYASTLEVRFTDYPSKLCINQGYQLGVDHQSKIPQLLWESSDNSVISVDQNGYITAHKAGSATIKATALDASNKSGTITINVTNDILQDVFVYTISSSDNYTATISGTVGASGEITIPRTVYLNGIQYSITSFASNLFEYNTNITKVNIPEGFTEIPYGAFQQASNLTEVNIPNSIKTISNNAFRGCTNLQKIFIPSGVSNIYFGAFSYCSSLSEIKVDENNPYFFDEDGVLFNVIYENHNYLACYPAGKTGTSYTVPSHAKTINTSSFEGASNLTEIILHDEISSLGVSAFRDCSSLTEITIPASVTEISNTLLYGCSSLKNVNIHNNVKSIYYGAFMGCTALESIVIPESVNYMESGIFANCTNLKSVTLPQNITSLGAETFGNCTSLETISIPANVKEIGANAFNGCTALSSITFPDGVTSLGNNTFQGCTSLTSMVIPNDVQKIGSYAFQGCSNLEKIRMPKNLESLGNNAFKECTSLKAIKLYNIKKIESSTFSGCTSLDSIVLPNSLEKIGLFAFYECSALKEITLPLNITNIDYCAFAYCSSLSTVYASSPTPATFDDTDAFKNIAEGATLYVSSAEAEVAYEADSNWTAFFDKDHIIFDEGVYSGIENISISNNENGNNAQPIIYNINGVRINEISQPGIYIINGKKVLVK